ncbi:MAG: hypothetical protein ACSHX8_04685 [Opitutaceae bacterium]
MPTVGSYSSRISFDTETVTFPVTANRSTLIETSTNLTNWFVLPDSDNTLFPPSSDGIRELDLPEDEPNLFIRALLSQP